jgi:hypothetical protein
LFSSTFPVCSFVLAAQTPAVGVCSSCMGLRKAADRKRERSRYVAFRSFDMLLCFHRHSRFVPEEAVSSQLSAVSRLLSALDTLFNVPRFIVHPLPSSANTLPDCARFRLGRLFSLTFPVCSFVFVAQTPAVGVCGLCMGLRKAADRKTGGPRYPGPRHFDMFLFFHRHSRFVPFTSRGVEQLRGREVSSRSWKLVWGCGASRISTSRPLSFLTPRLLDCSFIFHSCHLRWPGSVAA